ncbi:MAG: heavy metal-associated domain-containing protein, partial [Anaerolineae bacterium]|nr:heavy metal-associated domain-containing protein [Anaerolineae bacterium]
MAQRQTVEIPIKGMDCAECALHVQQAIARLPGVESVQVLLAAEKAIVRLDPEQVDLSAIRRAVAAAGDYWVPETASAIRPTSDLSRRPLMLLGIVFGMVLVAVVAGEWLGLFRALNERVPFP